MRKFVPTKLQLPPRKWNFTLRTKLPNPVDHILVQQNQEGDHNDFLDDPQIPAQPIIQLPAPLPIPQMPPQIPDRGIQIDNVQQPLIPPPLLIPHPVPEHPYPEDAHAMPDHPANSALPPTPPLSENESEHSNPPTPPNEEINAPVAPAQEGVKRNPGKYDRLLVDENIREQRIIIERDGDRPKRKPKKINRLVINSYAQTFMAYITAPRTSLHEALNNPALSKQILEAIKYELANMKSPRLMVPVKLENIPMCHRRDIINV